MATTERSGRVSQWRQGYRRNLESRNLGPRAWITRDRICDWNVGCIHTSRTTFPRSGNLQRRCSEARSHVEGGAGVAIRRHHTTRGTRTQIEHAFD